MVFIRFLEAKNKISSQVGGYAHPVVKYRALYRGINAIYDQNQAFQI